MEAYRYVKKFSLNVPWFDIKGISVWCMLHCCYDCKCFTDPDVYGDMEDFIESQKLKTIREDSPTPPESSENIDEVNDTNDNDTNSVFELDSIKEMNENPKCVVMCINIYKSSGPSQTAWMLKHWSHNGVDHSARTCGYSCQSVEKTYFVERYDQGIKYKSPKYPFITGTTFKNKLSNTNALLNLRNSEITPAVRDVREKILETISKQSSAPHYAEKLPTDEQQNTSKNVNENNSEVTECRPEIVDVTSSQNLEKAKPKSLSIIEMMNAEEARGELELDLTDNTPGNKLLVAESRFRKLINMNIVGVVGLNKSGRLVFFSF